MDYKNGHHITAKEIRDAFRISYSKINHYTNLGLFPIASKNGNKRLYDRQKVEDRFQSISKLVNEGYPLRLIRRKLIGAEGDELL